ncbi:MAG TPA: helix-turn-helix domain-containing protein [Chitinophagaceae bacterium]|nr:helix-turn-helix domain-containing protein [Chitinophagaceae bacterium]
MEQQNLILDKLTEIANKLDEQNLLQKTTLNFNEACKYLDVSPSHLYKLTSTKQIPHFCPQGKKLYFKREELDAWLQRNRQTADDSETDAADLVIRSRKS